MDAPDDALYQIPTCILPFADPSSRLRVKAISIAASNMIEDQR